MKNNEYLDNLMKELAEEGIQPPDSENNTSNNNVEDFELGMILKIQQDTNVTFSEEQLNILRHHGSACILACAGSGKTTLCINLIAKRILTGEIQDVNKMIYTTFSKSGATEMKERLDRLMATLGLGHIKVQVRTIHSFFLQVLRTFGVTADILSSHDRTRMVRQACKDAEFTLKNDELMIVDNLLSYQVNNLLSDKKLIDSYVNTLDDLDIDTYKKIRQSYSNQKNAKGVIDYDDMQSYLYLWLVKWSKSENPAEVEIATNVRNYCKAMWTNFYIDEAQDVSKLQFAILKAMVAVPNNPKILDRELVFIGDDDQCLVEGTEVITNNGIKKIEEVQAWDKVLTGCGHSQTMYSAVDAISKKYIEGKIYKIHTKSGKTIKGTGNHVGFAKIIPVDNLYYTYLMYKHDIGFRIGTTSAVRAGNRREVRNGIDVRLMQEKSDKIWILKTSESLEDSKYYEAYFAYKYSIPMYRFVTSDNYNGVPETSLGIESVKKLHKELNSFENGLRLLNDLGMYFEYPHRIPQAEGERCKINHSWFSSKQRSKYGMHKSEISINTSNQEYIDVFSDLLNMTDRTTDTKYNYKNARNTSPDLDEQMKLVKIIQDRCKDKGIYLEVDSDAKFTDNKYIQLPFSHMQKGMMIPTVEQYEENGYTCYRVVDDIIESIETELYKGYVYDLSIPDLRNFVANNVVVHNCIYEWRGSDPSIILTISATFDMPTYVLSKNYRCKNEVVDYAAAGIKYNNSRYNKGMSAHEQGGTVKIALSTRKDLCTLSNIALNHIKWWTKNGYKLSDIAVLCRNNNHLAILNNMLLREGIYCNMTEDMKFTNSYIYSDLKDIMDLTEPNWKYAITAKMLWRMCRFMGQANATKISKFQDTCNISFDQVIGWIVKKFIDKTIEYDNKVKVSLQAEQEMEYVVSRFGKETRDDLETLYRALSCADRKESIETLFFLYRSASAFMYKSKDKARALDGMISYLRQLVQKDGVEKTLDFLRVTEQLENGKMVIPGEKMTLSTIHSAKGREWRNVIMFACDNISEPSFDGIVNMINDDVPVADIVANIDEERRLFYVGNTRAKENLFTITYMEPSVFILEALGIIPNTGKNNYDIVEMAQDNEWAVRYKDKINDMLLNSDSKYFYNFDDYKVEED